MFQLDLSNDWSGLKRFSVRSTLIRSFALKSGTGRCSTSRCLSMVSDRRYVPICAKFVKYWLKYAKKAYRGSL